MSQLSHFAFRVKRSMTSNRESTYMTEIPVPMCHAIMAPHLLRLLSRLCISDDELLLVSSLFKLSILTTSPLSALHATCCVLRLREGASHLFEVTLQLQGLTPQVNSCLFTQSWCNSYGKPFPCHEYKGEPQSNGVSVTSTFVLF